MKALLKKLQEFMNRYVDKILHALFAYCILLTCHFIGLPLAVSIGVTVACSFLKEFIDEYMYHGFSVGDLIADVAGMVPALILILWRA